MQFENEINLKDTGLSSQKKTAEAFCENIWENMVLFTNNSRYGKKLIIILRLK